MLEREGKVERYIEMYREMYGRRARMEEVYMCAPIPSLSQPGRAPGELPLVTGPHRTPGGGGIKELASSIARNIILAK